MRSAILVLLIGGLASLAIVNLSFADDAAIRTMADITMKLNHFPTDADKQRLKAIADDEDNPESEIAVANALLNFQHKVAEGDKAKLASIADDDSAPAGLRQLAGVLVTIQHHPSESDVDKLQEIAAGPAK